MAEAVAAKTKKISRKSTGKQVRLWVRARFLGFRRYWNINFRSKVQQNTDQSILRLEGVNDRTAASYYFGKRVVYVFKTNSGEKDKRFRVNIIINLDNLGQNR